MKMKTFFKFVQVCVVYILVDGIVQFDAIRFQHIPKPNILKVLPLRPRKLQKQAPHPVPKQIPLHRQQKHPFALQDDENVHHNYNSLERKIHPHVQAGHNAVSGQGKHHPAYSNLNNNHIPQIHQHPHLARSENHQAPVHHELQNHHNLDGKVDHDLKKNHIPLVHHEVPNVGIEANHVPLSHQYRDHQVQRNLHNHIQAPGLDKVPNHKVHLGPPPPKQFTFLDRPTFYQRVRKYFSKTTAESSSPPISTTIVVTNSTTARTWLQYSLTQTSQKTRHPFKIVDDGPTKRVSSEYVPLEESKTTPKRISSEEIPLISDEKTTKHISSEYVPLESFGKTTKPISSEYVPLVSDEKTTKQVSSEYVPLVSDEAATTKHISSEYVTNEPPKTAIISEEFVSAEDTKTVTKKAKRDDSSSYDSDGEKRRLNRLSTFSYELDFYDAGTLFNLTEDEWKIWDENREQIMREAFPPEELTPVRNLTFDEVVRNFFNYEKIEDKYMPFYKWYYRILTNPQYMKELYNRTVVEELDYKNLSKYTPFPIPEPNQRYFMFINYLEDEIKKEQEEEKLAKQEKQQVEEEWDKILQDDVDEDVVDDDIVDESLSLALPSTPPPLRLQTTPPPQITIQQPDPPTSSTGAEQSRKPTRDKPLHLQEPGLRRQSPPNLKQQQNDQNAQAPAQAKTAQRMQTNKPPLVQQIKDSKENLFG